MSDRSDPEGTSTATEPVPGGSLWAPPYRNFTIGLVLVVTLVAFEAMGVATALPTIASELDGQRWYSWAFTLFMASSAVGTVFAGRLSDRHGPALPLLLALPLFATGLVVAGSAPSMPVLLGARALQGLGGGSVAVPLYVMIARVYPQRYRPRAFGVMSAAWVLPSLLGPAVSGLITEQLHWRWVFLGLAPLVLVGAVLLGSTVLRAGSGAEGEPTARRGLVLAGLGAGLATVALNWSADHPSALSGVLGVLAVGSLWGCLRVLLPSGTLSARPGIPVMVLARGLLAGIFFTAEAFIPLVLTVVHGYSAALAGIPLTVASLGWTAGSFWQARQHRFSREHLVAAGFLLVVVGVFGVVLAAPEWGADRAIFVFWSIGGAGMGVAISSTAVRVLGLSDPAERGFNSAALQISDMLGQALLVGFGGAVVNTLASTREPTAGVLVLAVGLMVTGSLGASLVARSRRIILDGR
ncbi:MFS transporter [Actinopolyspora erythraea]|uniref:MFS transporter n=1 Tax=Actinopolyspora erythraea TaxID=414996 RepID=A0ABR4WZK2_9ACTN|nr:MFS transporter [Actinopolyspora erythraea]KGI79837.1 MFS transporter [Actinopolyspora erythraea]